MVSHFTNSTKPTQITLPRNDIHLK
uniref:Uncharacterized protein n=1 Tax=Anguilla anguilla TaxID=7936 RepID=A0A0E9QH21_ANGAN